jgi:hypothetical protein
METTKNGLKKTPFGLFDPENEGKNDSSDVSHCLQIGEAGKPTRFLS